MVEDEDGFEIPTLPSQCVVVSEEDDQRQAGHAPMHQAPLTRAQMAARTAQSEADRLKEENGRLKEKIHALESEMSDLKLRLLKLQYQQTGSKKPGVNIQDVKTRPYERLRNGIIEVDLHSNNLLESTAGMNHTAILEYQLKVFRETIENYRAAKGQRIVFIHGKGEGVLRKAILDDLKLHFPRYESQDASFQQYGFGATMITIR